MKKSTSINERAVRARSMKLVSTAVAGIIAAGFTLAKVAPAFADADDAGKAAQGENNCKGHGHKCEGKDGCKHGGKKGAKKAPTQKAPKEAAPKKD